MPKITRLHLTESMRRQLKNANLGVCPLGCALADRRCHRHATMYDGHLLALVSILGAVSLIVEKQALLLKKYRARSEQDYT